MSNPVEKRPRRLADEAENERLHMNNVYYGYATRAGYRPYTHVRFYACKYLLSTLYSKASASFQTSTMPGLIRPLWDRVSFYLISLLFAPCNKTKNEANVTLCYCRVVCKLQVNSIRPSYVDRIPFPKYFAGYFRLNTESTSGEHDTPKSFFRLFRLVSVDRVSISRRAKDDREPWVSFAEKRSTERGKG